MQFEALSEQEIQESALLADGDYKAKFWEAMDKDSRNNQLTTKNGDPKIDFICHVFDEKERPRKIKGNLNPAFLKLLKHACDAVGLEDKYNSGDVGALDFKKKEHVVFGVKVGRRMYNNERTGEVIWVNQIEDFYKLESKCEDKSFNDDIKF